MKNDKLRFGVNYTPSKKWLYSWVDWDSAAILEDLQTIAGMGMDHIQEGIRQHPCLCKNPIHFLASGCILALCQAMCSLHFPNSCFHRQHRGNRVGIHQYGFMNAASWCGSINEHHDTKGGKCDPAIYLASGQEIGVCFFQLKRYFMSIVIE